MVFEVGGFAARFVGGELGIEVPARLGRIYPANLRVHKGQCLAKYFESASRSFWGC